MLVAAYAEVYLTIVVYNTKRFDINHSSKNTAIPTQKDYTK